MKLADVWQNEPVNESRVSKWDYLDLIKTDNFPDITVISRVTAFVRFDVAWDKNVYVEKVEKLTSLAKETKKMCILKYKIVILALQCVDTISRRCHSYVKSKRDS